ncbi:Crp/Fnr family transcriptional regulator [Novosphingobium subterraneum]|uniref:Crp/Fnr family transcriptional regulator n=1 Tax=Novosphingobium subterraneum TaxID=48936 RepID=A0A0B8ZSB4_9SPHN|nr:Crp/Fnr family transcriptional regulator [Novosphingobium subterraneum]
MRKVLKVLGLLLLAAAVVMAILAWRNWDLIQRVFLGGVKVYETVPPQIPANIPRPAVLVFSKTNAFRHEEAIPAAAKMFDALARQNGWGLYQTENGAAFSPEILSRFDAVVFSNVTGDVFTPEQRAAFKAYLENGGGYVGIHGAGDNSHKAWDWYVTSVIGTNFIGHPMDPQFQSAAVNVETHAHPSTASLPDRFDHVDEWYSFDKSPRGIPGLTVLATIDEGSYKPGSFMGTELAMGKDHPVAWWRCIGQGRVFYAAAGHTAQTYDDPQYRQFLTGAVQWAMKRAGSDCGSDAASAAGPAQGKQPK